MYQFIACINKDGVVKEYLYIPLNSHLPYHFPHDENVSE